MSERYVTCGVDRGPFAVGSACPVCGHGFETHIRRTGETCSVCLTVQEIHDASDERLAELEDRVSALDFLVRPLG